MPVCIFMQYPINYYCSQTSMFCCVSPFHWPFTSPRTINGKKWRFESQLTAEIAMSGWWLSPTPLKNDGVKVSWDDEIPNWMESEKIPWFQSPPTRCLLEFPCVKSPRPQNSHRTIELQGTRHLSHSRHGLARPCCPTPTSIPRPHPGECQEPWRTMALSLKCREIREHHAGLLMSSPAFSSWFSLFSG